MKSKTSVFRLVWTFMPLGWKTWELSLWHTGSALIIFEPKQEEASFCPVTICRLQWNRLDSSHAVSMVTTRISLGNMSVFPNDVTASFPPSFRPPGPTGPDISNWCVSTSNSGPMRSYRGQFRYYDTAVRWSDMAVMSWEQIVFLLPVLVLMSLLWWLSQFECVEKCVWFGFVSSTLSGHKAWL